MADVDVATLGLAALAVAAFVGALVQAASGFGFAIVAAPVFLAVTGSKAVIPLLVLLHLIQSAMLVPAVWRDAPAPLLRRLLAGAAVGCPVGLVLFLYANVRALEISIGVLILGVTALIVARQRGWIGAATGRPGRASPARAGPGFAGQAWPATTTGAVSGLMTSLLVMPGPPLMVWSMGAGLGMAEARALSLSFFAVCYAGVSLLNIGAGQVGRSTWLHFLLLAPAVVAGTLAGMRVVRHISELWFRRIVLALLALSGLGAVASALR